MVSRCLFPLANGIQTRVKYFGVQHVFPMDAVPAYKNGARQRDSVNILFLFFFFFLFQASIHLFSPLQFHLFFFSCTYLVHHYIQYIIILIQYVNQLLINFCYSYRFYASILQLIILYITAYKQLDDVSDNFCVIFFFVFTMYLDPFLILFLFLHLFYNSFN